MQYLLIFLLAFVVESMTEYLFGRWFEQIPTIAKHKWLLMYVSAGVGVALSIFYRIDLISTIGLAVASAADPPTPTDPTWVGMTITGLAIGRGSNYLHDLVGKFFVKQPAK